MSGFSFAKFLGSFRKPMSSAEINGLNDISGTIDGQLVAESITDANNNTVDLSLVAVITAAVAMMMSNENGPSAPYPGFVVKRIRRLI